MESMRSDTLTAKIYVSYVLQYSDDDSTSQPSQFVKSLGSEELYGGTCLFLKFILKCKKVLVPHLQKYTPLA